MGVAKAIGIATACRTVYGVRCAMPGDPGVSPGCPRACSADGAGRGGCGSALCLWRGPGQGLPQPHLWSHCIALAATVGFKGVDIVMGSVRNRKKFRSARSQVQVGHLKLDITYPLCFMASAERAESTRRGRVSRGSR
eukprot:6218564-Prymnesium_polylepis.1